MKAVLFKKTSPSSGVCFHSAIRSSMAFKKVAWHLKMTSQYEKIAVTSSAVKIGFLVSSPENPSSWRCFCFLSHCSGGVLKGTTKSLKMAVRDFTYVFSVSSTSSAMRFLNSRIFAVSPGISPSSETSISTTELDLALSKPEIPIFFSQALMSSGRLKSLATCSSCSTKLSFTLAFPVYKYSTSDWRTEKLVISFILISFAALFIPKSRLKCSHRAARMAL
mmetsp:Transcript_11420/g.15845  ORF Transcript_11420/g.15845 Transcript_11420/m.15845 type:complete len:221 (-) Transcript_11420:589-1251(-)